MKSLSKCALSMLVFIISCEIAFAGKATNSVAISTNKPTVVISTFIIPTKPSQGRDPFFPESTRLFKNAPVTTNKVAVITSLTVKGISKIGTPMVIINNRTFAIGDTEDVATPGGPVHVHCLAIKQDRVTIEADGRKYELHFQPDEK